MTTLAVPRLDTPTVRPVLQFTAVALPLGWVLLTVPILFDLPAEPFVLATTILGLLLPAVLITVRRDGRDAAKALLRQAVRPHRPLWWLAAAVLVLPAAVWLAGAAVGGAEPPRGAVLGTFAFQLVSSAIVINIWEELAWTGFVQRRLMARWGLFGGSTVTALLFALIHAPLAFAGAGDGDDVLMGFAILISTGIGLRLLIAAVDAWSVGSLLVIGLLHGAFNASASLVDPDYDVVRLAVTIVLGTAAAFAVVRGRRH
jgi:membrane protease YdiL (CAAX protease family)